MDIDENNHLMVTLSDDSIIDAGEVPVGEGSGEGGSGGASNEEIQALQAELADTKQRLLDLTYGVDYEWIHIIDQTASGSAKIPFTETDVPEFYEEWHAAENSGDAAIEEFIMSMY
jgi:hypothetical protein